MMQNEQHAEPPQTAVIYVRLAKPTCEGVIYCRVSSVAQTQRSQVMLSQETRCREFARMKRYEPEKRIRLPAYFLARTSLGAWRGES